LQGDDGQYDEEGNQARTFDDEQDYLDSGDDEDMETMGGADDDKVGCSSVEIWIFFSKIVFANAMMQIWLIILFGKGIKWLLEAHLTYIESVH
jgi:hypothetical protein